MAGKSTTGHDPGRRARATTSIDVCIGRRLHDRRRMMRISQEELAAVIGIAAQQIQKYENGSNRISVSRLVELAAALRVPVAWFFRADAAAMAEDPSGADGLDDLCRLYHAIADAELRSTLLVVAEAFAGAAAKRG